MDISKQEKTIRELFVGNCWSYLHDNFHKFSDTNKIKIALEICKKDQPTKFDGALKITTMPSIKINDTPLEFDIGEPVNRIARDVADTEQAIAPVDEV